MIPIAIVNLLMATANFYIFHYNNSFIKNALYFGVGTTQAIYGLMTLNGKIWNMQNISWQALLWGLTISQILWMVAKRRKEANRRQEAKHA